MNTVAFTAEVIIFFCFLVIITIFSAALIKSIAAEREIKRQQEAEFQEKRAMISGKRKISKFARFKQNLIYTIDVIHMPRTVFFVMEIGATVVGFVAGKLILTSGFLSCCMAALGAGIPLTFVFVSASWYKQNEAAMLESCMTMITGSYRANKDIIKSVEDNINKPNMPVAFKNFLTEVHFVNSNTEKALRRVAASFNNRYFDEWIEVIIKSQYNSIMIDILPSIIAEMNEYKKAQKEASIAMKTVWREYALWVVTTVCVPLILRLNNEWYNALVGTPVGKGMVVALLLGVANSLRIMVSISKPIDL